MKRVLSLILAISMVMSMFTFAFAGTQLSDVAGTEYESAVEALVELGIVNGYEDGTYRPNEKVSRAEMAKLLVVAAGLEPAAKLVEGATKFADVNGGWASGYVNVASEYGFVMGDPDGNFRPDDQVSYAEAATMALRVLGYKSVVEAKGTWPTNYIAKAEDLEMLEDITYASYNVGATRGNIALLIWNMLTTEMWDVKGESEGNGLESGYIGKTMLEVKFPDYSFSIAEFVGYDITDDAEVEVSLTKADDEKYTCDDTEYVYDENDFYTFVEGTEVEVLVNEKDGTLLSMVRTGKDKLVEGSKLDLDDDYDALSGDVYLYAYAMVEKREIVESTQLTAESEYVFELNTSNKKYIKLNDSKKLYFDDMESEVILKDGERATIDDIEVGDVWTKVTVNGDADLAFYMIDSTEVEGKLTKVVVENFDVARLGSYVTATIAKEDYIVAKEAKYAEDGEDIEKATNKTFVQANPDDYNEKMKGEEVTAILDVFGRVVFVMFDGKIDAGEEEDTFGSKFFAITGPVEREGSEYFLPVESLDGEDTLKFASKSIGNAEWVSPDDPTGTFALITLNEDGEIAYLTSLEVEDGSRETAAKLMISYNNSGDSSFDGVYGYGDDTEKTETYTVKTIAAAKFKKGDSVLVDTAVVNDDGFKVTDATVVVNAILDDKGTTKKADDEYKVLLSEGADELAGFSGRAVVVTDNASKLNDTKAKYVVVFEEVSTGEEGLFGIVADAHKNRLAQWLVTVSETLITDASELKEAKKDAMILDADASQDIKDALEAEAIAGVLYSTRVNKDDEVEITIEGAIMTYELDTAHVSGDKHAYVLGEKANGEVSEDGRAAMVKTDAGEIPVDLDSEDFEDYADFRVVIANVELEEDSDTQYVIESFDEVDFADFTFDYLDRISVDSTNEIVLVIRGMATR